MSTIPVLMVQYVNDTTEIRYSDGARLELSPCGSVFQYEAPRSPSRHPIQGADVVRQRSAFVTSQYRDQLLQALDFRNRFAERPYICQAHFPQEDIVLLYSNIVEAAWPKTSEEAEVLQDGSIKLTSQDEFASLVLSPHGRDFTVCYLSKTSTSPPPSQPELPRRQHSSPAESRERHVSGGSYSGVSDKSDGSFKLDRKTSKKRSDAKRKHKGAQFGSLAVQPSATSAFVAVSQRQPRHKRQSSNPKYSDGESSSHSIQSYDSMASSTEDELCSSYHELNIQAMHKSQKHSTNLTSSVPKSRSNRHRGNQSNCVPPHISPNISPISRDSSQLPCGLIGQARCVPGGDVCGGSQSKSRQYYCWVSQHVSCLDCPRYWSHPATLVQERWRKLRSQTISADIEKERNQNNNNCRISPDKLFDQRDTTLCTDQSYACMCELPPPVPLTCIGQHLHSWFQSPDHDPFTCKGNVKVVMSEGVIYRLVGASSLRQVEIYPGDNSVLTSQGLTGHFFVHVVPKADNSVIEEKTYSVKVPPQDYPGAAYSVAKLITRGAQHLSNTDMDVQIKARNQVCCWKEETTLSDSSSRPAALKCEHNVPGLGKFLAYTNGRIRIVFADRTALDMRVESLPDGHTPSYHGDGLGLNSTMTCRNVYDTQKAKVWGELIPAGHCRLLLPSGQYSLIQLHNPGKFKMYVDYALEWSAWSNTPVSHRAKFYTDSSTADSSRDISPDTELRKINCFNYVVENTVLKQQTLGLDSAGDSPDLLPADRLCYRAPQSLPVSASTTTLHHSQIQSFDDVRRALQKTSQVIHDIDSLLSTCK